MRYLSIRLSWLVAAAMANGACSTLGSLPGSLEAEQRHQLYARCVDSQMKRAAFGSGMAVHRACLDWANSRL